MVISSEEERKKEKEQHRFVCVGAICSQVSNQTSSKKENVLRAVSVWPTAVNVKGPILNPFSAWTTVELPCMISYTKKNKDETPVNSTFSPLFAAL